MMSIIYLKLFRKWGTWGVQLVKCLPSTGVMILESWDQEPHVGLALFPVESLLLLPLCLLSLSIINEIFI